MAALGPDLQQQALVRQQMAAAKQRGGWVGRGAAPLPQPLTGAALRAASASGAGPFGNTRPPLPSRARCRPRFLLLSYFRCDIRTSVCGTSLPCDLRH